MGVVGVIDIYWGFVFIGVMFLFGLCFYLGCVFVWR